ncbi:MULTISPECIES: DMT family transporter [Bradyrhizobium]|jgi:drug/metabolite transporter (DMT)-like permease|uniref:DMT family transporter n=1 Tax=Bradyrhizobium TaxID=374 RepID=UPI0004887752|nr:MULTISPECIES: DMT family transporter [Bradyrhizobium]MCS3453207.1 drug/metabolite transporter (DMT)-like permease [Bradyrhizobium elkanii]MCS3564685.1 drug/metabolite transporter (DMT)-like permease [Bradyrhizobium elkanii]MCW2145483.1 drug/metabolite transporter (DMT)-like permease [Bradyrhizobium elkanii]MCW2355699.1 drug/metabolite transporter (DMT)-like permease [Bradyrhizobium elkanii]MCW2378310.1 drug/metabolite transporter (DMT)-like permease [Bradyrhizobium elkanii]
MDTTQRDRTIGFLCLVVTAFGWALNWPLMKLLLQQWPPLFARGLAGTCAAVILGTLALARGQSLAVPREVIPRLLFASFTNVFAWMGFGTIAMKFVTVGEGALLAYTMPIWAMLFAWPVLHSRPTLRDLAALVLGVAGVALLLGGNGFAFSADKLTGIALALACAILFALGNVLNRKPLPMPPLAVVAWQVGIGCFVMLLLGILFEHPNYAAITPLGLGCFAYMTLMPMGICYLTWFETLRRLPPTSASTGMLLVPVIGVVSAAIILGEPLGLREIGAMALTLGGVTLALQRA